MEVGDGGLSWDVVDWEDGSGMGDGAFFHSREDFIICVSLWVLGV